MVGLVGLPPVVPAKDADGGGESPGCADMVYGDGLGLSSGLGMGSVRLQWTLAEGGEIPLEGSRAVHPNGLSERPHGEEDTNAEDAIPPERILTLYFEP